VFGGYRYRLTGGLIDFTNPTRSAAFDVSLVTRVRDRVLSINRRLS
jgi:hypothetical protein